MREEVKEIINMLCPDLDLDSEDLNLAEDMNSIDIIALIAELEDKFDIEVTMQDKTEENFENIDTLVDMIERLQ